MEQKRDALCESALKLAGREAYRWISAGAEAKNARSCEAIHPFAPNDVAPI